jgi:hypothetical protein
MGKFNDFFSNLQFIFKPKFWHMNEHYCKEWDVELKRLMSEHNFTDIENCTAKLDGRVIWVANYPYSSFMPYEPNNKDLNKDKHKYRPSRLTIKRAMEKLEHDMVRDFGRVKTPSEREREAIQQMKEGKKHMEEIQRRIDDLTRIIRNHPHNVTKYKNNDSLQNNTKVRKHTFKYG